MGCGCGAFMGHIQGKYPRASVYGIELFSKAAGFAKTMGEVICGDVEHMEFPWPENFFDYMVFGDVLEHLKFPYEDAGILDRTHRKLYTGREISGLIERSGYRIERMEGITRGETGEQRRRLEELLSGLGLPDTESFFQYQYLVKAVKEPDALLP